MGELRELDRVVWICFTEEISSRCLSRGAICIKQHSIAVILTSSCAKNQSSKRGIWVAQSVGCATLDFSSGRGHDQVKGSGLATALG